MATLIHGKGKEMQPSHVLLKLVSLLGSSSRLKSGSSEVEEEEWSNLPWENNTHSVDTNTNISDDEINSSCDFSSFPSLSLQKNSRSGLEGRPHDLTQNKDEVESHVASLLARPLLVSNDPEKRLDDEEDDDEDDDFVVEKVSDVPQLMQQNVVHSFSTLVQSRLRAYATFLARHGLSLAASTEPSNNLEDGVVGVEQKLETLLELGNAIALGDVTVSFTAKQEEVSTKCDEDDLHVKMPLLFETAVAVLIPTCNGTPESHTINLASSGSITGIFTKNRKITTLRVVQVDLDMIELLTSMKEGAASTVSRIVERTNAAYSVPLPRILSKNFAPQGFMAEAVAEMQPTRKEDQNSKKRHAHVIEDDQSPTTPDLAAEAVPGRQPSDLDLLDLEEGVSSLTPDKCGKIVDSLFDKIDARVLSPPGKRARFNSDTDVDAISLTPPVV